MKQILYEYIIKKGVHKNAYGGCLNIVYSKNLESLIQIFIFLKLVII